MGEGKTQVQSRRKRVTFEQTAYTVAIVALVGEALNFKDMIPPDELWPRREACAVSDEDRRSKIRHASESAPLPSPMQWALFIDFQSYYHNYFEPFEPRQA